MKKNKAIPGALANSYLHVGTLAGPSWDPQVILQPLSGNYLPDYGQGSLSSIQAGEEPTKLWAPEPLGVKGTKVHPSLG